MKIKYPIAIFIVLSGAILASVILFFPNLFSYKSVAQISPYWTQETGSGLSVPACGSTDASVTCSNGHPSVTISWSYQGGHGSCDFANIYLTSGLLLVANQQCSGSWTGTKSYSGNYFDPNTSYAYTVQFWRTADINMGTFDEIDAVNGSFITPSCTLPVNQLPGDFNLSVGGGLACNSVPLSWTASSGATAYRILRGNPQVDISPYQLYTALNFTDTSVSQNTTYQYQIEAYNSGGTNRSNTINVATPYCPPTINFSGSPTSIFQGQSTTLTWSTSYTTSCTASGAWSGSKSVSGSEVVIPSPPPSVTYTLICTGPGGSTSPQSVTINITPLALPNWREIIPR